MKIHLEVAWFSGDSSNSSFSLSSWKIKKSMFDSNVFSFLNLSQQIVQKYHLNFLIVARFLISYEQPVLPLKEQANKLNKQVISYSFKHYLVTFRFHLLLQAFLGPFPSRLPRKYPNRPRCLWLASHARGNVGTEKK